MRCLSHALCLLALTVRTAAQPDPAPYLYYFSPERHAFVVERADGTDSRLFGQGVIPINAVAADGVWSPSGEYFAWQTEKHWIEYVDSRQMNEAEPTYGILSADGIPLPDLLPRREYQRPQYRWSPVEDLLFATLGPWPQEPNIFTLIDPQAETVLAELSFEDSDGRATPPVWTQDGAAVIALYLYHAPDLDKPRSSRQYTRLYSFTRTGEIHDVAIGCFEVCTDAHLKPPAISPRGEYLILDPASGEPALYDLTSGTSTPVANPDDATQPRVFWSADGAFALLLSPGGAWVFDRSQLEIRRISSGYGSSFMYEEYFDSPPQVWSPDGRFAAWAGGTVQVWDSATNDVRTFPIANSQNAVWASDSRTVLVPVADVRNEVSIIDAVIGEATHVPISLTVYSYDAWPSPNGRYWGIATGNDGKADLFDIESGIITSYTEHAIAHTSPQPGLYDLYNSDSSWRWSADGSWFIVTHYAFWAGGGGSGPLAVVVYRLGELQGRDLGFDSGEAAWLPDAAAARLGLP